MAKPRMTKTNTVMMMVAALVVGVAVVLSIEAKRPLPTPSNAWRPSSADCRTRGEALQRRNDEIRRDLKLAAGTFPKEREALLAGLSGRQDQLDRDIAAFEAVCK